MNSKERESWVRNDEGLYNWWHSSKQSMSLFLKENRVEIDQAIARVVGRRSLDEAMAIYREVNRPTY